MRRLQTIYTINRQLALLISAFRVGNIEVRFILVIKVVILCARLWKQQITNKQKTRRTELCKLNIYRKMEFTKRRRYGKRPGGPVTFQLTVWPAKFPSFCRQICIQGAVSIRSAGSGTDVRSK